VCAWVLAQGTKMMIALARTRRVDFSYLASTGGMPSAHSASVSALAASVGISSGYGTPVFAASLCFAVVVMFDAATVRRATGAQARLLNDIIDEMFVEHHLSQRKLAELLGHTRLEVFMGMIIGVLVAVLVNALAMRFA
jgi:acid phosphatase family membrane protein YuiD